MQRCKKLADIYSLQKNTYIYPEPKRDWSVSRVLSGHRIYVIAYLIAGVVVLYKIQTWIWPIERTPQTLIEIAWSYGTLLWIAQIIPISLGFAGLISYQHPKHLLIRTLKAKVFIARNPDQLGFSACQF